jgi:hypothetical protein
VKEVSCGFIAKEFEREVGEVIFPAISRKVLFSSLSPCSPSGSRKLLSLHFLLFDHLSILDDGYLIASSYNMTILPSYNNNGSSITILKTQTASQQQQQQLR